MLPLSEGCLLELANKYVFFVKEIVEESLINGI